MNKEKQRGYENEDAIERENEVKKEYQRKMSK